MKLTEEQKMENYENSLSPEKKLAFQVEKENITLNVIKKSLSSAKFNSFLAIGGCAVFTALDVSAISSLSNPLTISNASEILNMGAIFAIGTMALAAILSFKIAKDEIVSVKELSDLKEKHLDNLSSLLGNKDIIKENMKDIRLNNTENTGKSDLSLPNSSLAF